MNRLDASADVVAAVTLAIGSALLVAPARTSTVLGLPAGARSIGAADLVLGAGLAAARPHWPWMAVRSLLNVVLAGVYLRGRARRGAAAVAVLAANDGCLAVLLRSRGR